MRDRLQLQLSVSDAAGNDRAAKRVRARLHDEAAGREVIGKGIVNDIALAESRREKCTCRAPPIACRTLGLENRPW